MGGEAAPDQSLRFICQFPYTGFATASQPIGDKSPRHKHFSIATEFTLLTDVETGVTAP